jgi:hypothetical protein
VCIRAVERGVGGGGFFFRARRVSDVATRESREFHSDSPNEHTESRGNLPSGSTSPGVQNIAATTRFYGRQVAKIRDVPTRRAHSEPR